MKTYKKKNKNFKFKSNYKKKKTIKRFNFKINTKKK